MGRRHVGGASLKVQDVLKVERPAHQRVETRARIAVKGITMYCRDDQTRKDGYKGVNGEE